MSRPPVSLILSALALALPPAAADAQHRREQDNVRFGVQSGQVVPLAKIEQQIIARMPGCDYLGPEYDQDSATYRLKFMRNGSLIWVDVDARTGSVIRQSGR